MTHLEKIEIVEKYLEEKGMSKSDLVQNIEGISKRYGLNVLSPNFARKTPAWLNGVVYMIVCTSHDAQTIRNKMKKFLELQKHWL